MDKAIRKAWLIFFVTLVLQPAFGQPDSIGRLAKKFDDYWEQHLPEKIFIHTDQTFYLTGETVWLNVFLVDGFLHRPSDLSKVAYIELIDKDNSSVLKTKVSLANGNGSATLFLPSSIISGKYDMVGYTQWMRNFSEHVYFHQILTIVNPFVPLDQKTEDEKSSYDVQFFPEGGNLVNGLRSTVAFRVVNRKGIGINFDGEVLNTKNETVARLSPLKFGLGRFQFTPEAGKQYRMVFVDSLGQKVVTSIPAASENGYVLHLSDLNDSIKVDVESKFIESSKNLWFSLFVQSRQIRVYSRSQVPSNGKTSFWIDKKMLREGINHITLFDATNRPVCERLFFKAPIHRLQLDLKSDRRIYSTRGKLEVEITSRNADGHPSNPLMSISVYRLDSMEQNEPMDISNYLWLISELKGTIESPGYYLHGNPDKQAVDNLMLTHGWSRFNWEDIQHQRNKPIRFAPEYGGHLVTGLVFNQNGKHAAGVNTYFSIVGRDAQLYVSRSDADGKVRYEVGNLLGKKRVVLQADSKMDSTLRIELDPAFAGLREKIIMPDFHFSEKNKNGLVERNLSMQVQRSFENKIRYEPVLADSLPFYGLPNEAYRLDDYTRFPTTEEVFREYIKGIMVRKRGDRFHFMTLDRANNTLFRDNPLVMIDGAPIFNLNKLMAYDPHKIQKIDVMTKQYYLGHLTFDGLVNCTTYHGDLLDYTPDFASVLQVEGMQPEREFFSPLYETKAEQDSRIPDRRDLLFWSSSVKSDNNGKSHLTFYSSDLSGTYRIVLQALSEEGEFGSTMSTIQVTK